MQAGWIEVVLENLATIAGLLGVLIGGALGFFGSWLERRWALNDQKRRWRRSDLQGIVDRTEALLEEVIRLRTYFIAEAKGEKWDVSANIEITNRVLVPLERVRVTLEAEQDPTLKQLGMSLDQAVHRLLQGQTLRENDSAGEARTICAQIISRAREFMV